MLLSFGVYKSDSAAPANTHAHSSRPPRRLAYWVWLEEIGGRSTQGAKMTENHSISNGSPLGPPSRVLQEKAVTESSPTDRVERLLKKYKVDKIYLSQAVAAGK